MPHPLVDQLRFTRSEFQRALDGITDEEARRRFMPMNCISWIAGHMAWHEQLNWLTRTQGQVLVPEVNELAANGGAPSTPPLNTMREAWQSITRASDTFLDTITTDQLSTFMIVNGKPHRESIGSMMHRITYHYWYHIGESQAIRQMLGHRDLSQFVGAIHAEAPYRPE